MSFFDEPKNAGLALIIVAIISVIAGIANIVLGVIDDAGVQTANIVIAIGSIIGAIVYFKYGSSVRSGSVSAKIDILGGFVNAVGIVTIIGGIFTFVAGFVGYEGGIASGIISVILGLIICWCGKKINDGKQTTVDKIIWIILLIIFIIELLLNIVALIGFPIGTILGICGIIIYIFMLTLLFDGEVKKEMGM